MNIDNKNLRPEDLEALTSQQLDELLHTELEKDVPDSEIVLPILHILEERETCDPNNDVDVDAVWKAYQEDFQKNISLPGKAVQKDRKPRLWLGRVAAIAAIVCLLVIAVPKAMGAENIFEILGRWTQTIFEFFDPTGSTEPTEGYVFKTDHPGLQQIYDAVAEHGATQPVVPRWVPEGFELDEVKVTKTPLSRKVYAGLYNGDKSITIAYEIYREGRSNQYTKDDESVEMYEKEGINHYIMSNDDGIQVVWIFENVECVIWTECEKEVLYQIIKSIYMGVG